jgi:hypothetical protein
MRQEGQEVRREVAGGEQIERRVEREKGGEREGQAERKGGEREKDK